MRADLMCHVRIRCRVGIELPQIEVRYEHLSVEAEVYVGARALPTLLNSAINVVEVSYIHAAMHPACCSISSKYKHSS